MRGWCRGLVFTWRQRAERGWCRGLVYTWRQDLCRVVPWPCVYLEAGFVQGGAVALCLPGGRELCEGGVVDFGPVPHPRPLPDLHL